MVICGVVVSPPPVSLYSTDQLLQLLTEVCVTTNLLVFVPSPLSFPHPFFPLPAYPSPTDKRARKIQLVDLGGLRTP